MGALEIALSGNRTRFLSRTFRGGLCLGLRSSGRLLLVRLPVLFDHVVKRHPHTSLCVHTCQPTPTTPLQITSARVYSSLLCACCVRAIDFRLPSMPVVVGSIPLSSKSWSPARRASLPRFAQLTERTASLGFARVPNSQEFNHFVRDVFFFFFGIQKLILPREAGGRVGNRASTPAHRQSSRSSLDPARRGSGTLRTISLNTHTNNSPTLCS